VIAWPRRMCATTLIAAACCGVVACGSTSGSRPVLLPNVILWTQSPHGREEEAGTIGRAAPSGTSATGRFAVGASTPAGIAMSGQYIYWANHGSGTIARAKLDGADVDEKFITGAESPIGIAVDDQHIYWTNSGIFANEATIGRADLDGSHVNQRFIRPGGTLTGLAVNNDHIYWTHYQTEDDRAPEYTIGRANVDRSGVNERFIVTSNRLDGVAVNGGYIYWSNDGEHAIGRANLDGTDISQRCITLTDVPLENVPEGLAADGRHIFWTNYPADTIARANLDGSHVDEHFVAVDGVPEGIVVGGSTSSPPRGGSCPTSKPPLLLGPTDQKAGPYQEGWGEVAPAVISNGGASASGTIRQIHWSSWGGKVAAGRGLNPTFRPQGGYYSRPVVIELRASAIRRCEPGGRLVYSRFTTREHVRPGGPMGKWWPWDSNMCTGKPM